MPGANCALASPAPAGWPWRRRAASVKRAARPGRGWRPFSQAASQASRVAGCKSSHFARPPARQPARQPAGLGPSHPAPSRAIASRRFASLFGLAARAAFQGEHAAQPAPTRLRLAHPSHSRASRTRSLGSAAAARGPPTVSGRRQAADNSRGARHRLGAGRRCAGRQAGGEAPAAWRPGAIVFLWRKQVDKRRTNERGPATIRPPSGRARLEFNAMGRGRRALQASGLAQPPCGRPRAAPRRMCAPAVWRRVVSSQFGGALSACEAASASASAASRRAKIKTAAANRLAWRGRRVYRRRHRSMASPDSSSNTWLNPAAAAAARQSGWQACGRADERSRNRWLIAAAC